MSPVVVRVADLRTALECALEAFERAHGTQVVVERDHYWHLPVDASFDLSHEPRDVTVGSLCDDVDEVAEIVAAGDAAPAWHALNHAIGLLRLLEHVARP